jgi:hypothetical protein
MGTPLRLLSIFLWCVGLWISSSNEGLSSEGWERRAREWREFVGLRFTPDNLQLRDDSQVHSWLNQSMQAIQREDNVFFCGSGQDSTDVLTLGCNNQEIPTVFPLRTQFNVLSAETKGYISVETMIERKEKFIPLIQAQVYLRLFLNHFFLSQLKQVGLNSGAQKAVEKVKRVKRDPKVYQAQLINNIIDLMKEEAIAYKGCLKAMLESLFVKYPDLVMSPECLKKYMTCDGIFLIHDYPSPDSNSRIIRQIFNTCNNLCDRNVHVADQSIDHSENTASTLKSEHLQDCETVFRIMTKKAFVAAFYEKQMLQFIGFASVINKKMTALQRPKLLSDARSIDELMEDFKQISKKEKKRGKWNKNKDKDKDKPTNPQSNGLVSHSGAEDDPSPDLADDASVSSHPSESSLPDESPEDREEEIAALQLQIEEQLVLIGSQNDQLFSLHEANSTLSIAVQERDAVVAELLQQLKTSDETIVGLRRKLKEVIALKKEANRKCFESQTQHKDREGKLQELYAARELDAKEIASLKQNKGILEMSIKQNQALIDKAKKSQVDEAKRAADLQAERDRVMEDNRQAVLKLEGLRKQKEEAERMAQLAQEQIDYWKRVGEQCEISYQQSRSSNLSLLEELSALRQEVKALKSTKNGSATVLQKE